MKTLDERVNYAARVIREGRNTSRKFNSCFEMGDGDLVLAALVARADKSKGKLADNLANYIANSSREGAR